MKWGAILGKALATLATTIIIVELGEFMILAYVWLFTTGAKVVSFLDNVVIVGTTLMTIFANLSVCAVSLFSFGLKKVWPTVNVFVGVGLSTAAIQIVFIALGAISFDSFWLRDFFDAKQLSFVAGTVSSLVLVAVALIIRPWHALSMRRF